MRRIGKFLAIVVILLAVSKADAATLYVGPNETCKTIQSGIDAAQNGDVVIVRDGTYTGDGNRDIDFKGKAIHLRSENGPSTCVIDCQGTPQALHRGFYFHTGEKGDSIVEGLTITRGAADATEPLLLDGGWDGGNYGHHEGGAVLCEGTSPTIIGNMITNCVAYYGAGIACTASASPTIADNVISNNAASGCGGGISLEDGPAAIVGNTISANSSIGGGGISCHASYTTIVTITGNVVSGNTATACFGGGMFISSGFAQIVGNTISGNQVVGNTSPPYQRALKRGGGVCFGNYGGYGNGSEFNLMNNTIAWNSTEGIGGGVYSEFFRGGRIVGNTIAHNRADGGGGGICTASPVEVTGNIVAANAARVTGGGLWVWGGGPTTFTNNSIAGNTAPLGSGIHLDVADYEGAPVISNCILWGNIAASGDQVYIEGWDRGEVPLTGLRYNDIEGGKAGVTVGPACAISWGTGNIDADPLFADQANGDFHLRSVGGRWDAATGNWVIDDLHSPCIDAGDPASVWADEPQPNGNRINLGADGNTPSASKSYAGSTWALTVISIPVKGAPVTGSVAGTTDFSVSVTRGKVVELCATQAGTLFFLRWEDQNGTVLSRKARTSFIMDGNRSIVAVYGPVTEFYVNDSDPDGGIAAGDNENPGTSPEYPMASIQMLLNRYPMIGHGVALHVAGGTYMEHLYISPAHSGLSLCGAGANSTFIDGQKVGPCVFLDQVDDIIISGFTMTNGLSSRIGAGMCIIGGSPTIAQNTLVGNAVAGDHYVTPGFFGQYIGWRIEGGGAIGVSGGTPKILDNRVTGNTAAGGRYDTEAAGSGGGIRLMNCTAVISGNVITGNSAKSSGGGFSAAGSTVVFSNNVLEGNSAPTGGAIYCVESTSLTAVSNLIAGNTATDGAGVCTYGANTVFTNNTLTGNVATRSGGGWIGASGTGHTIKNTILWGNTAPQGRDVCLTQGGVSISYSDIAGGKASVYQETGSTLTWGSGNIDANPLFVDPANGDYELSPKSPAIDSGTGIGAPATDVLGRPRRDDTGMPNIGVGYPCYVDMGAYERQQDTPSIDFAVIRVGDPVPSIAGPGDQFSIDWTVLANGTAPCTGPWQDAVYLSDDPYLGSDDVLVGTQVFSGTLSPDATYTRSLTATVPAGVTGVKYVLICADADRALADADMSNNVRASGKALVAINVPLLEIGVPATGTLTEGKWCYYRFVAEPGRTVRFSLDAGDGDCWLYVRRDLPPTVSWFDVSGLSFGQRHQDARLLNPAAATYCVGFYARHLPGGSSSYTVTAQYTTLCVREVTPANVGNTGRVTLDIAGDGFAPEAQVELRSVNGGVRIPSEVLYRNSAALLATFDLTGAVPGEYNVVATIPGPQSGTWSSTLKVIAGGAPRLKAELIMPAATRQARVIDAIVAYSNTGTVDLRSPLFMLTSDRTDLAWQLPGCSDWVAGPKVSLIGISSEGRSSILRPGQRELVRVRMLMPEAANSVSVTLLSAGAPGDAAVPIDWGAMEAALRPSGIDPATWNSVFGRFRSQVGDTWSQYLVALAADADRLALAGRHTYDLHELLGMELDKAYGLPTGIVSGRAIHRDTREAVGNTSIRAYGIDSLGYADGLTDEAGAFILYGLDVGRCEIHVAGHIVQPDQEVAIPPDGDLHGIELAVTDAGGIRGKVASAPGSIPVPGAVLSVAGETIGISAGSVTDDYGQFSFDELPAGLYTVRCSSQTYGGRITEHVSVSQNAEARLDFLLVPGGSIRGKATAAEDGSPIAGARVEALLPSGVLLDAETNEQGEYVVNWLPAGPLALSAECKSRVASAYPSVEMPASGDVVCDFSLLKGSSIAGKVMDTQGMSLEQVLVQAVSDAGNGLTLTDGFGNYLIDGLPAGAYDIGVDSEGYICPSTEQRTLSQGEALSAVNFILPSGPVLQGTVVEADGTTPIAGAELTVTDRTGAVWLAASGAGGRFSTGVLAPGDYIVRTVAGDRIADSRMVAILSSGEPGAMTIVLLPGACIRGVVTKSDGTSPAPGIMVATAIDGTIVAATVTSSTGAYSMPALRSGTYTVSASGSTAFFEPAQVSVTAGQEKVVNLAAGGLTVEGVVFDATVFSMLEGAIVTATLQGHHDATPQVLACQTDALGQYRFDQMVEGAYLITATARGFGRGAASIEVNTPHVLHDFWMYPGVNVEGFVTDASTGQPVPDAVVSLTCAQASGDDPGLSAFSDGNGWYQVADVAPGAYVAYCRASGYTPASPRSGAVTGPQSLDWSLQHDGACIRGQVREATTGKPVWAQTVLLKGENLLRTSETDLQGQFSFISIPTGTFELCFMSYPYQPSALVTVTIPLEQVVHDLTLDLAGSGQGQLGYPNGVNTPLRTVSEADQPLGNDRSISGPAASGSSSVSLPVPPMPRRPTRSRCTNLDAQYDALVNLYENSFLKLMDAQDRLAEQLTKVKGAEAEYQRLVAQRNAELAWLWGWAVSKWRTAMGRLAEDAWQTAQDLLQAIQDGDSERIGEIGLSLIDDKLDAAIFTKHALALSGIVMQIDAQQKLIEAERQDYLRALDRYNKLCADYEQQLKDYEAANERCDKDAPDPPGQIQASATTQIVRGGDPEAKFGPAGYDPPGTPESSKKRFVPGDQTMPYRIEFWNDPSATAAAQDATFKDTIIPAVFDLSTFEFTRIGFLKWDVPLQGGQAFYTRVDMRPEMNLAVDVVGTFDSVTGEAQWYFHSIDPMTGDYPENAYDGFLPPFNPETEFELGWIEYTVKPKPGLPTGTVLPNQAFGQFDLVGPFTPGPKEGPWINTIDAGAPTSNVKPITDAVAPPGGAGIPVQWTGQDDAKGSGVASYDVFMATDSGQFIRWQQDTTQTQATFTGKPGHQYSFYSVARDNVGNIEQPPAQPDTAVRVRLFGDVNGDCKVNVLDLILVRNRLGQSPSTGDNWKMDVNQDGAINVLDLIRVRNELGGKCD